MTTTKNTKVTTATATTTMTPDNAPSSSSPARALERVDADVSKQVRARSDFLGWHDHDTDARTLPPQVRDKASSSSTATQNVMNDAAQTTARAEEGVVSAFKKAKKATRAGAQVRARIGADADYMARTDNSLVIIRDKSKHLIVGIREHVERAVHAVEVRVNAKDVDE